MEINNRDVVFNLWDTNGRRNDVLNALSIYLGILDDLKETGRTSKWAHYPDSLAQFEFYKRAIEKSPEVFKQHPKFDQFIQSLGNDVQHFLAIDKQWLSKKTDDFFKTLDIDIESRARHYTSNLVKIGFVNSSREITPAGYCFLNSSIILDELEKTLPINETNLVLLRQLMKLRIYSKPGRDGARAYYAPFFMALYLLLRKDPISKDDFRDIVQGTNPYLSEEIKAVICDPESSIESIHNLLVKKDHLIPGPFCNSSKVSKCEFDLYIKNRKSGEATNTYYEFYSALFDFREARNDDTFERLKSVYLRGSNKEALKKAFGRGQSVFDFGVNGLADRVTFETNNCENTFLKTNSFNACFYSEYFISKYIDGLQEYSDTTMRMLGASGLFKLKRGLPELAMKKVVQCIFDGFDFPAHIFGKSSNEEYEAYEQGDSPLFGEPQSLSTILGFDRAAVDRILEKIRSECHAVPGDEIKTILRNQVSSDFAIYVEKHYPISKVIDLLKLFSNRANDSQIVKEVNESANPPTIFEYVVGLAWYYAFNKSYDVYKSFNLTLNADFEPELNAGGGQGDIMISLPDKSVMIEVTLMNKYAQKRGEWEPVLRHSLNNTSEAGKMGKKAITFFVADDLDFNTINIWRAVASVPLQSSASGEIVNGVMIMPITNAELVKILEEKISAESLIEKVEDSFEKTDKITDDSWRKAIIKEAVAI